MPIWPLDISPKIINPPLIMDVTCLHKNYTPDLSHDDVIKWKHFPRNWPFYAGNSPVPGEFPTQRPVTRSFDVYFDLRPNKRLSKQSSGWRFESQSRPLWRHRNGTINLSRTHDNSKIWKHFPHHWPFVRGIHQVTVDSPYKGPFMRSFNFFWQFVEQTVNWPMIWDAILMFHGHSYSHTIYCWQCCFSVKLHPCNLLSIICHSDVIIDHSCYSNHL